MTRCWGAAWCWCGAGAVGHPCRCMHMQHSTVQQAGMCRAQTACPATGSAVAADSQGPVYGTDSALVHDAGLWMHGFMVHSSPKFMAHSPLSLADAALSPLPAPCRTLASPASYYGMGLTTHCVHLTLLAGLWQARQPGGGAGHPLLCHGRHGALHRGAGAPLGHNRSRLVAWRGWAGAPWATTAAGW